jgi:hypothetical protein
MVWFERSDVLCPESCLTVNGINLVRILSWTCYDLSVNWMVFLMVQWTGSWSEGGQSYLKTNNDKALSDESLKKSIANEMLNTKQKTMGMKQWSVYRFWTVESLNPLTFHRLASSLHCCQIYVSSCRIFHTTVQDFMPNFPYNSAGFFNTYMKANKTV